MHNRLLLAPILAASIACGSRSPSEEPEPVGTTAEALSNLVAFPNASGSSATYSTNGKLDERNAFFASLGTNGRSCATCHAPATGFTFTPQRARALFDSSGGTAPLFRANDGANSPDADVSTVEARRAAYSMLLTRGVIRVGIGVPPNADFEVTAIDDPYGYAKPTELSLFRRPLTSTNLKFNAAVMWDGREPDLGSQANSATLGHAQASGPLTAAQQASIVAFETALFTAQVKDSAAGDLQEDGAKGGPVFLSSQPFSVGENPPPATNLSVFTIYDAWRPSLLDALTLTFGFRIRDGVAIVATVGAAFPGDDAKAAVYRGQQIFNTRRLVIPLTDPPEADLPVPPPPNTAPPGFLGTCSGCHSAFNAGSDSLVGFHAQVGISTGSVRTSDLPLYTLRNKTTGLTTQTTDPGRALITGLWSDVGRFKAPGLRGLSSRAPYFHNGSAATLADVVDLYDARFTMKLTAGEKSDLVAFLQVL